MFAIIAILICICRSGAVIIIMSSVHSNAIVVSKAEPEREGKKTDHSHLIFPVLFFSLTYAFWRWDQFRVRANVTLRTTCRSRHKYRMCDQKFYISQQNGLSITKHCALVFQTSMNILLVCGFFFSFSLSLALLHIGRKCEKYDVDFFIWNRKQTINIAHYIYEQTFVFTETKNNTNRQENKLLAYLYGWI